LNNYNNFVTLTNTMLRFHEDAEDTLIHVGVLTIYIVLLIYVYVVFLLVWIIICTKCTLRTSK